MGGGGPLVQMGSLLEHQYRISLHSLNGSQWICPEERKEQLRLEEERQKEEQKKKEEEEQRLLKETLEKAAADEKRREEEAKRFQLEARQETTAHRAGLDTHSLIAILQSNTAMLRHMAGATQATCAGAHFMFTDLDASKSNLFY